MRLKLLLVILLLPCALAAQNFNNIRHYLDSAETKTYTTTNMLTSYRGLDVFFARKIAYYLSASNDVSLFTNYAILNPGDDKLFYGHNWAFRSGDAGRVKSMLTLGANLNYSNSFAAIVDNKKFQGTDASINIKYTWFNKGKIKFDSTSQIQLRPDSTKAGPQKMKMDSARQILLAKIKCKIGKDSADIMCIQQNKMNNHFGNLDLTGQFADLEDGYKEEFETGEAKELEKKSRYNLLRTSWWYTALTIPLGSNTYSISPDIVSDFNQVSIYPLKFDLSHNVVWQSKKTVYFINVGTSFFRKNSVLDESLTKLSYNEYKNRGGVDTVRFLQLESNDVYIGKYSAYYGANINAQFVCFPGKLSNIGFSLYAEQLFGPQSTLNGRIGIPIKQSGKGEDNPINIEIQGRFSDLSNRLYPHKAVFEKFSLGITIAVPFNSIKY